MPSFNEIAMNPGGDEAVRRGCTCSRMNNGYGRGYMGSPYHFVIAMGCPLHDKSKPYDSDADFTESGMGPNAERK